MTLTIQDSEVFCKLNTESESLIFSESCVRSDIADIIKKIYSPRPINRNNTPTDSAAEYDEMVGDNITISRSKEKEEKRFGFYFEPVTGNVAKTLVDSSTTSGSVSLPIVRYKPKRLRNVCECCKRKIPVREHELRVKRTRWNCRICKQNDCSDVWGYSTTAGVRIEENPSVHTNKIKVSNGEIVQPIHPSSRPSSKLIGRIPTSSISLARKQSSTNLAMKHSGNLCNVEKSKVKLNCTSVLNLQLGPDSTTEKETDKRDKIFKRNDKGEEGRKVSLLQRAVSNLFGKNKQVKILDEVAHQHSQKPNNIGCVQETVSKNTMKLEKTAKQLRNKEISANLEQVKSCKFYEISEDIGITRSLSKVEVVKSDVGLPLDSTLLDNGQKVTCEQNENQEKLYSCSEHMLTGSKFDEIDKNNEEENRKYQGFQMCDQDVNSIHSNENLIGEGESLSRKPKTKFQVAYNSLTIEVDTDWAYEFWGEIFGVCHKVVSFFMAFFLHLLTFILQSLVQPVFFGTLRISSDHFFKPCLLTAFESLILPLCNLIERFTGSLRDVSLPVAQCFGVYCKEVSHICRACRIVEIHKNYHFNEEPTNLC